MTDTDKLYYQEMLKKGRLIPFIKDDKLVCFVTFYITDDESEYINAYPWDVLEDNPNGKICYVAQYLTTKVPDNPRLSYEIWHRFKIYIKTNFPTVKLICWRRWNNEKGIVKTYKKELRNV